MKLIKKAVSGKFIRMRRRHNKRIFILGFLVGGAAAFAASKLLGKSKRIKHILAGKE